MHDYEVETVHTIKVIQRRTITAVNMVAAQKLSNMQWEVYPDEQFEDGVAFVRKERSELKTKVTKVEKSTMMPATHENLQRLRARQLLGMGY
jgi:hypothetical protein